MLCTHCHLRFRLSQRSKASANTSKYFGASEKPCVLADLCEHFFRFERPADVSLFPSRVDSSYSTDIAGHKALVELLTRIMNPSSPNPTRDQIAAEYFESLPFAPYPVQEEALLAWFTSEQGVLVCAPTGTGKTLIAEAAIYEALRSGTRTYYTTPLIALTDQKFDEIRQAAVRWGFSADDVGLVTGNRRVNATAPVLVVVAEILLNRLLQPNDFDFSEVSSVVMDEFHSFNDPERGIVWELSLGLLPAHVRTLLLSATVGNSVEFSSWLTRSCNRRLQLVQSAERKVPLSFQWVGDFMLDEWIEKMVEGTIEARRTPALIFCFNRDECWQVAELLKGKKVVDKAQQANLATALERYDWSEGAGPKIKAILQRGIGIHHAGILPKYRRVVEELFQAKLLSVAVCTETLSAGINLPARSVVLPTILKGPKDRRKVIEASSAQQIFGRAGRPQFDKEGFVYALAHEDDVKLLRWREKYDQIPEDTKDPGLMRAKKALKKKMPRRRDGETYWTEDQFNKLRIAPAAKLASRGPLPWRLLAYMLLKSPEVQPLRDLVGRRLLEPAQMLQSQKQLNQMLITLWTGGYLELDPKPTPLASSGKTNAPTTSNPKPDASAIPTVLAVCWTQPAWDNWSIVSVPKHRHHRSIKAPRPPTRKTLTTMPCSIRVAPNRHPNSMKRIVATILKTIDPSARHQPSDWTCWYDCAVSIRCTASSWLVIWQLPTKPSGWLL